MPARHQSTWGTKIGPRIAILVSQALVYTHHKLHHLKHRLAMAVFHSISDEISEEVDTTLGPIISALHDLMPEDHPAYPAVNFLRTQQGQLKAIVGAGAQMSGLLGTVSAIMNNALAPEVYNTVGAAPRQLPDAPTIVSSFNTGLVEYDEAIRGLSSQGIQHGWSDRMLGLGYTPISQGDILELLRRDEILTEDAKSLFARNGIRPQDITQLLKLTSLPVSVADAALAVLRGNIDQAEGEKIAAANGIDSAGFAILIGNTGEPPGLQQLMEAFRRGFIDQATLEKGIRESRYRNEWIPMLEKLRYSPMSVSDAVRATVQNQLSADAARSIADQNGLEPGQFDILVSTEGNPLSRTEMADLYNRGLATEDEFKQAIRESRYKNKYVDKAFELHQPLPPTETVTRALRHGVIDHTQAVAAIMHHGYSDQDAAMIVAAGTAERTQVFKDRVVSALVTLYEDGIMSSADLTSNLNSLGFSSAEVAYIVKAAGFHQQARLISASISAIRSKYLGHHITEQVASGLLDKIGIASEQRDTLLKQWAIDSSAATRLLTPAQIVKAHKMQLISDDDAASRLLAQGYNDIDAALLLSGA